MDIVKILYGSQNFGYDTPESDKDYMKLNLPSWEDILIGKMPGKTVINSAGLIKELDFRKYVNCLLKGGFSDLQTLYAVEYEDCENLGWFIANRDRIAHVDLYRLYDTNMGCMNTTYRRKDFRDKDLVHMYVFNDLLHKILSGTEFSIYDTKYGKYRQMVSKWNTARIKQEADLILQDSKDLKPKFEEYADKVDSKCIREMREYY